jgi:hypothetical protein
MHRALDLCGVGWSEQITFVIEMREFLNYNPVPWRDSILRPIATQAKAIPLCRSLRQGDESVFYAKLDKLIYENPSF